MITNSFMRRLCVLGILMFIACGGGRGGCCESKTREGPAPGSAAKAEVPDEEQQDVVRRIVVMLEASVDGAHSFGAGVVVSDKGGVLQILTANHNIRSAGGKAADWVKVWTADAPDQELPARVADEYDPKLDIGLVRAKLPAAANGSERAPLPLDAVKTRTPRRGQETRRIGQPNQRRWWSSPRTDPVVQVEADHIQFESASIAHGDSGGALVSQDGALLGIIIEDSAPPTATAVRIDRLQKLCAKWRIPFVLGNPSLAGDERANQAAPADDDEGEARGEEWIRLRVVVTRLPAVRGIFFNRTFALHVFHGDTDRKVSLSLNEATLTSPFRVDPGESIRVLLEMVARVGSDDPVTDTRDVYPDLSLRSGKRLSLKLLPTFLSQYPHLAATPSANLTIQSVPFYPGHASGNDRRASGARDLPRNSLTEESISFNEGDDLDFLRIAAKPPPCVVAILAPQSRGVVIERTDAQGRDATGLKAVFESSELSMRLWIIACAEIGEGRLLVRASQPDVATKYRVYVGGAHQPGADQLVSAWLNELLGESAGRTNLTSETLTSAARATERLLTTFHGDRCLVVRLLNRSAGHRDNFHNPLPMLEAIVQAELGSYRSVLATCPAPSVSAITSLLALEQNQQADPGALSTAAAELDNARVVRLLKELAARPQHDATPRVLKAILDRKDLEKETLDLAKRIQLELRPGRHD
jgi:hypothetical protein